MEELVERIAAGEITRDDVRRQTARKAEEPKAGRPKNFVFQLKDKDLPFSFNMTFRKARVEKEELIDALKQILRRLES